MEATSSPETMVPIYENTQEGYPIKLQSYPL
jgi:hypothetical protein